jgi:hypothetical protein
METRREPRTSKSSDSSASQSMLTSTPWEARPELGAPAPPTTRSTRYARAHTRTHARKHADTQTHMHVLCMHPRTNTYMDYMRIHIYMALYAELFDVVIVVGPDVRPCLLIFVPSSACGCLANALRCTSFSQSPNRTCQAKAHHRPAASLTRAYKLSEDPWPCTTHCSSQRVKELDVCHLGIDVCAFHVHSY